MSHIYPTITIRRPDGTVKTVSVATKVAYVTDAIFKAIKVATAQAGRGDVLSYRNCCSQLPSMPSMGPGWCDRCQSYCYGDCTASER